MPPPSSSLICTGGGCRATAPVPMVGAMEAVLNVALPVFAITLAGYLAGRLGILGEASSEALNRFVYYFALPPLLFIALARVPVEEILRGPFLAAITLCMALTILIAVIGGRWLFGCRRSELVLHGLTAGFANSGYMGIPLFIAAFGEGGALPAIIYTVVNTVLFLGAGIAFVEADRSASSSAIGLARDVALALVKNPLVVAPILGIAVSAVGIAVPRPIVAYCEVMGAAAAPGALFAMGLFLVGKAVTRGAVEVGWLTFVKLLVHPALTWVLCFRIFPVEPFWAAAAVITAALPTGALVFVVSQRYGVYVQRSSAAILISTILSVVTVSALLIVYGP